MKHSFLNIYEVDFFVSPVASYLEVICLCHMAESNNIL